MDPLNSLKEILIENRSIRLVEDGIYSVLPDSADQAHYDRRAALYDLIVGANLYHKVMWGTTSRSYTEFAGRAIRSMPRGKIADAGCGSLLFTAQAYIESDKQIIAFDQSLNML